jgi:acyl carrier protein
MRENFKQVVKDYIMAEFLPGEDPAELTDATPLITGGILDSIATLKLVLFMEDRWQIAFAPHEVDRENLDTLPLIAGLLAEKVGAT